MVTKLSVVALILLVWLSLIGGGCSKDSPVARTTANGPVEGIIQDSIEVYRGIPYAEPPVGENRWREPRPHKPWKENLRCVEFRSSCIQPKVSELEGGGDVGKTSEDCLYLNIWTPVKREKKRLPVMVWIHGGAFMTGSGSVPIYSGDNLARKGVVVVTINYRLGPFGFLVHPDLSREASDGTAGNYGLKDQIEALKWVKRNIASFGGDPDRVTIFGESAGAISVGYLLLAPSAKGLFYGAIMQSGAPTTQKYVMPSARGSLTQALVTGKELAKRLGYEARKDAVREMRMKTPQEIMKAADMSLDFIFKNKGLVFAPASDGHFLAGEPDKLVAEGRLHDVPVLLGTNRDEASLFTGDISPAEYKDWISINFRNRATTIISRFPGEGVGDLNAPANRFLAALWFTEPARFLARSISQKGGRAYLYYFRHVPKYGLIKEFGSFHGQEIEYVFGNLGKILSTDNDKALSRSIMDYWVNFAATGDPNSQKLTHWPAYDVKRDPHMELGTAITAGTGLEKEICDFVEKVRSLK